MQRIFTHGLIKMMIRTENGEWKTQAEIDREKAKTEKEKTFECYTLCEEDITHVAEQKGLSLEGIDLDDVAYYIKKGVSAGIEDVRDEIIENAINSLNDLTESAGRNLAERIKAIQNFGDGYITIIPKEPKGEKKL